MVMIKTKSIFRFIVVIAIIIGAGTALLSIDTSMNVYAQNMTMPPASQEQQNQTDDPFTSLSTDQTIEGWMTSFDLENCDFASSGENSYFVLEPGTKLF